MVDIADIMAERFPAELFHPYEYIREEMEARGWTHHDVARAMTLDDDSFALNYLALDMYEAVSDPTFDSHYNCRMGGMAEGLARAFGTSVEFWRNLEAAWLKGKPAEVDNG